MQARIYRFEIVRALANAVYEVKDPATGALLTLYEWTPAAADREPAKRRLNELADDLPFEVFTADASLYLVAGSRAQAVDGLRALQAHGLFPGVWLDQAPPPVQPVQPVQPAPVKPVRVPPPVPRHKPALTRFWYGVAAFLAIAVGVFALGYGMGRPAQPEAKPAVIPENRSNRELQQTRTRLMEAQSLAALRLRELSGFTGVNSLRMKNSSQQSYQIAVACLGFNGLVTVQGWTTIPAGKTSIVAVSPGTTFFYYAKRSDGVAVPGSEKPFGVEEGDFVYYRGEPLPGLTPVSPRQAAPGMVELR